MKMDINLKEKSKYSLMEEMSTLRKKFKAVEANNNTTAFAQESSKIINDIFQAMENSLLKAGSLQSAVDFVIESHYDRTADWDILSQQITDSVLFAFIHKFFGKPTMEKPGI